MNLEEFGQLSRSSMFLLWMGSRQLLVAKYQDMLTDGGNSLIRHVDVLLFGMKESWQNWIECTRPESERTGNTGPVSSNLTLSAKKEL